MIKYACLDQTTLEYIYVNTREELQDLLAQAAAKVFIDHYCGGQPYTIVDVKEDGSELWYSPTGHQVMTPLELAMQIKYRKSFEDAGVIPITFFTT